MHYIHVCGCIHRYFFYIFLLKSYRTFDSNICHTTSAASKVHKIFKRKHYCKLVSVCMCACVCWWQCVSYMWYKNIWNSVAFQSTVQPPFALYQADTHAHACPFLLREFELWLCKQDCRLVYMYIWQKYLQIFCLSQLTRTLASATAQRRQHRRKPELKVSLKSHQHKWP